MIAWLLGLWMALVPTTLPPEHGTGVHGQSAKAPWVVRLTATALPDSDKVDVLKLPYRLAECTTNYYHASPTQAANIELAAKRLNGTVVGPGSQFSYYRVVGPYTAANGYGWGRAFVGDRIVPSVGGGVCQGASTLYAAVLRTDLVVTERHQHGLTVPYLPPGEDATVAADYLNFRFRNPRTSPVLITAAAAQRHLKVTLWGAVPAPPITVHHEIVERYRFRTIEQYDPHLPAGKTEILAPGQDGCLVKSWRTIQTVTGTVTQPLGTDRYRASPRVIAYGPKD